MSTLKSPLVASIVDASIIIAGKAYTEWLGFAGYTGKPLYLYTTQNGTTLGVEITTEHDVARGNQPTTGPVTDINVTVLVRGAVTATKSWSIVLPPGAGGAPALGPGQTLAVGMTLEPDLRTAHLGLTDTPNPYDAVTDSLVYYLLVQDQETKSFTMKWIYDRIWVEDSVGRADASVVAPLKNDPGILGPMGFTTP